MVKSLLPNAVLDVPIGMGTMVGAAINLIARLLALGTPQLTLPFVMFTSSLAMAHTLVGRFPTASLLAQ